MANIDVRKENGGKQIATREQEPRLEPYRMMRDLLSWDPFRAMAPLWSSLTGIGLPAMPAIDRYEHGEPSAWSPRFDVTETPSAYVFRADVPGVAQEDLEIATTGNRVQISGWRDTEREAERGTVFAYERQRGSFCRTFTLPDGADLDRARSTLAHGVLTLEIPKREGAQARRIPISSASPAQTPNQTQNQSPSQSPNQTPNQSPNQSPSQSPSQLGSASPGHGAKP